MKITLIVLFLTAFLGMLLAGVTREVRVSEASVNTFGSQHVQPKIMIKSGTLLPNGTVLTESIATGGTVYGTVEVNDLIVSGTVQVDGQVLVGNRLWSPLGNLVLSSAGNPGAVAPSKAVVSWKDVNVHGSLIIHGSLIVHGNFSPLGNLSIGGLMGPSCNPGRVFFPAGAYPIATAVDFGCPRQ